MGRYNLAQVADQDFETIFEYGLDNFVLKLRFVIKML